MIETPASSATSRMVSSLLSGILCSPSLIGPLCDQGLCFEKPAASSLPSEEASELDQRRMRDRLLHDCRAAAWPWMRGLDQLDGGSDNRKHRYSQGLSWDCP